MIRLASFEKTECLKSRHVYFEYSDRRAQILSAKEARRTFLVSTKKTMAEKPSGSSSVGHLGDEYRHNSI